MIDIRHLRENPQAYEASAAERGIKVDIEKLLKLDDERNQLIGAMDELRSRLNVKGKPTDEQLGALKAAKAKLEQTDKKFRKLDESYQDLIMRVPNLLAEGTPEGGEEHNALVREWGDIKIGNAGVSNHMTLAEKKGWLDFERGAKVAGTKFYYLKGAPVRLEMALMRFAMDKLEAAGFTLMSVPHMVTGRVAEGTGFLPRGEEDQTYKIEGEDLHLIATAEAPLTGYHTDEILAGKELPALYAALSPAYRKEAGAYGKHSRGLFRVHQFDKLEMYIFCPPNESEAWHEKLVKLEEDICRELEIPYRVVRIAAGDLGAPAYKKYDIEYWSPADQSYRELTSCSNVTDYQARRLNIRYRTTEGKPEYVHTLNGTAIAFSRVFIALIENHQTAAGEVAIPAALQPYYGGKVL